MAKTALEGNSQGERKRERDPDILGGAIGEKGLTWREAKIGINERPMLHRERRVLMIMMMML